MSVHQYISIARRKHANLFLSRMTSFLTEISALKKWQFSSTADFWKINLKRRKKRGIKQTIALYCYICIIERQDHNIFLAFTTCNLLVACIVSSLYDLCLSRRNGGTSVDPSLSRGLETSVEQLIGIVRKIGRDDDGFPLLFCFTHPLTGSLQGAHTDEQTGYHLLTRGKLYCSAGSYVHMPREKSNIIVCGLKEEEYRNDGTTGKINHYDLVYTLPADERPIRRSFIFSYKMS